MVEPFALSIGSDIALKLPLKNGWRAVAGLNGLMAILMGALSAHAINDPHLASLAERASIYQLAHSIVLLFLSEQQGRSYTWARWTFLAGVVLFCGSLYLKALTGWSQATELAPAGGIAFMVGWLLICLGK